MGALRRSAGFTRYAASVQYHGASFLGFSWQGESGEDCISPDGTDLRGWQSVEGRIRQALRALLDQNDHDEDQSSPALFENIQVSSRTDRGVHALKNTFHVDIRPKKQRSGALPLRPEQLHRGLNYYLARLVPGSASRDDDTNRFRMKRPHKKVCGLFHEKHDPWTPNRLPPGNQVRILSVKPAPHFMVNPFAADTTSTGSSRHNSSSPENPDLVDWNARFSATERTYVYRIVNVTGAAVDWAVPFEWDRCWRIRTTGSTMNVNDMQRAASFLVGRHDFTSFRASRCQRLSPVVTLSDVRVFSQPYYGFMGAATAAAPSLALENETTRRAPDSSFLVPSLNDSCQVITILFRGEAFLYRQVRNMVGCLAHVGRGGMSPTAVPDLLAAKDRSKAPTMAPAHGLFLVDVQHGNFAL